MKPHFIEEFSKEYDKAKADASKQYLVALIELPNTPLHEAIINPRANFEAKATYYMHNYNELGVLKANPGVRMVAYKFVDDLEKAMEFIYSYS